MTDVADQILHRFSQSDRYVWMDRPVVAPGCCFFCRKADSAYYVDLKMQSEHPVGIAMDGAVYMCSDCIDFIARLCGYSLFPDGAVELAKSLDKDLAIERKKSESLRRTLIDFLNCGDSVPDGMVQHATSILETVDNDPIYNREPTEPEPGSVESTDDEGMVELRTDNDSGGKFRFA